MQDKYLNAIHFQVILHLSDLEKTNSNAALLQVTACLGEKMQILENYLQTATKEGDTSKQNQISLCYPVN